MRRLERLGVWSWHSSRSVIHIRKGGVCVSSWPLVVAVSWQGRGCPREGCWPARLHSLRLIIFTRGLSSVRAPENRSFLFPFPLLLCHRSFFHHLSRIRATISNVSLFSSRGTFSFSFFLLSSPPRSAEIIGYIFLTVVRYEKIIFWTWCPYWEENCINSKIYFGITLAVKIRCPCVLLCVFYQW